MMDASPSTSSSVTTFASDSSNECHSRGQITNDEMFASAAATLKDQLMSKNGYFEIYSFLFFFLLSYASSL